MVASLATERPLALVDAPLPSLAFAFQPTERDDAAREMRVWRLLQARLTARKRQVILTDTHHGLDGGTPAGVTDRAVMDATSLFPPAHVIPAIVAPPHGPRHDPLGDPIAPRGDRANAALAAVTIIMLHPTEEASSRSEGTSVVETSLKAQGQPM